MKALKKLLTVLLVIAVILTGIFLAGRYGWKLGGFRACQSAGITSVEVSEKAVQITGFYPGSFPEGFCGYYAQEQDGKLYVGFRFSAVFGFFETGDFDVTIPVKGEISEVILKTSLNETSVWNAQAGLISQSERYGVYVKLERNDVYSVSMSYDGIGGGVSHADFTAMDSGEYCFMDNDIMIASKEADAPVPFTITVKDAEGTEVASGEFSFDASMDKLYLTVTADGESWRTKIMKDKHFTSRMLICAGVLMSISGILIAICAKIAFGGILFVAAACMFFAAGNFRIAEDRKANENQKAETEHEPK